MIQADNALGAPRGDVDDGFALSALFCSDYPILAVSSIFGNTSERWAHENNQFLGGLCGYQGKYFRGPSSPKATPCETNRFLKTLSSPCRLLLLGPLTSLNQIESEKIEEVIIVGTQSNTVGRWPPWLPFEYNLTKDKNATLQVWNSPLPLTVIPLNVAKRLSVELKMVKDLPGDLGKLLYHYSKRWFIRARFLAKLKVPIWDLVAALYLLYPEEFETQTVSSKVHSNTWVRYHTGNRSVRLVSNFDPGQLWNRFTQLLLEKSSPANPT